MRATEQFTDATINGKITPIRFIDGIGFISGREDEYAAVRMGVRDHINGGARYLFPTDKAAKRFAKWHKRRDPWRTVHIDNLDGTRAEYTKTGLTISDADLDILAAEHRASPTGATYLALESAIAPYRKKAEQ